MLWTTYSKKQFLKISWSVVRGRIWFFVDNDSQGYKLPCCGSFALGFSALIRFPLTMLWVNLLYFASMYFRSGTFKTSYLPKGYVMYLRLKTRMQVRNSSKNYKKSFLLFRHSVMNSDFLVESFGICCTKNLWYKSQF